MIVGPTRDDENNYKGCRINPQGASIQPHEATSIPDSRLHISPAVVDEEFWDFGSVALPGENPGFVYYTVGSGASIMVQCAALSILALATCGRMRPQRLWRLAMVQNWGDGVGDVIPGIDYGTGMEQYLWDQDPLVVPNMTFEEIFDLETLGSVGLVKKYLIHEGGFWIWMRPDR